MSFLEEMNINQMVIDAEIQGISEHLFQEWMDSNLDEGSFYADFRFAEMCDSKEIKKAFNQFYDLKPDEQYYVEVE
jgi:HSP20 family molecular chaperone IbpA